MKRMTRAEFLIYLESWIKENMADKTTSEVAGYFNEHPTAMYEVLRGKREPSGRIVEKLGFVKRKVSYFEPVR